MAIAKPFLALSREAIFESCVNKARISSLKPIWMALALEGNRLVRYPINHCTGLFGYRTNRFPSNANAIHIGFNDEMRALFTQLSKIASLDNAKKGLAMAIGRIRRAAMHFLRLH